MPLVDNCVVICVDCRDVYLRLVKLVCPISWLHLFRLLLLVGEYGFSLLILATAAAEAAATTTTTTQISS